MLVHDAVLIVYLFRQGGSRRRIRPVKAKTVNSNVEQSRDDWDAALLAGMPDTPLKHPAVGKQPGAVSKSASDKDSQLKRIGSGVRIYFTFLCYMCCSPLSRASIYGHGWTP